MDVSVLEFLLVPWFYALLLLIPAISEWRHDNRRDAGLLFFLSALAATVALLATVLLIVNGVDWHAPASFQWK